MSEQDRIGEQESEVIVLTDEDGNEHEFELAQVINVNDKDYAILIPVNGLESIGGAKNTMFDGEDEAVILRIDTENGEDILVEIEDEEEFDAVAEAWEELLDTEEFEEQN